MLCLLIACLLAGASYSTFACNEAEAFGFQFGRAVPANATDVNEFWFRGGTGPGNVARSFMADVPAPLPGFTNYAYWSNRDRQVVQLRRSWKEKYGFVYVATTKSEWEAKTPKVTSTIGTIGGEYLYVECVNNALQTKARSIAFDSAFK